MHKKYLAEFIGTFILALTVYLGSSMSAALSVPMLAAITVGVLVYAIGPISGCHINPAVTIGAWSLGKISRVDAASYLAAQFVGAALALALGSAIVGGIGISISASFDMTMMLAEMLGTAMLTFGIASVVYGRAPTGASGLVIGGALMIGVMLAALAGSAGILNPAVALAVGSLNLTYLLGPILGSLAGMWTYRALA